MKVFFVVGAARSGTTLLTRLLSAHERVHLHHERRVLEIAGVAGGLLRTGGRAVEPNPPGDVLARDLVRGRAYAESVLRAGAAEGTAWFGDKYPPYARQIPMLAAVWPDARIIHIVRDGRGVVASWLHTWPRDHAWRRGNRVPPVPDIARGWSESVDAAHEAGQRLGPGRYLAIRYDDLLEDPLGTGDRLLALLGEDRTDSFTAALAEVSPRGDWRRDLSAAELASIETEPRAAATLARWGWALEAPPDPPSDSADDWADRARAAATVAEARRAWLRVLRIDPGNPDAVSALMTTDRHRGESLFALMNLVPGRLPDAAERVEALLRTRGLDPAAASALVGQDR